MTHIVERPGFRIILRGSPSRTIASDYECPLCGRFAVDVERDAQGDPPAVIVCLCGLPAEWRITASAVARARLFEVVKGKSEKPQRKTWMDTRDLGEGQPIEEWRERRAEIWDERRRQDLSELIKDGPNPAF